MNCYLCNAVAFNEREGQVRDAPEIKILECQNCGLVQLDQCEKITYRFYEESRMHGSKVMEIHEWLNECEWDDQRRYEQLMSLLPNKHVLDFGSGAGGFLLKARNLAATVVGIELEERVRRHWQSRLSIVSSIDEALALSGGRGYDLITAFHVVEHLRDPRETLQKLGALLTAEGRMIIEVPSADDALLTLFNCDAFQRFTYWSQHLYLFTASTLATLIGQVGLKVLSIQYYQRYPLSNHLHWLGVGMPGGHQKWSFLNSDQLVKSYSLALASIGKTDTLIATVEK
jgi:cyclopropane fatty-acyl-phospholipid synthase-like methyltransferase